MLGQDSQGNWVQGFRFRFVIFGPDWGIESRETKPHPKSKTLEYLNFFDKGLDHFSQLIKP